MAQVNRDSVDPAIKAVQTRKCRYATFKLNAETMLIELDKQSARSASYKDFVKDLKDNLPRFCLYDYEYLSPDGRRTSSLYCISWMPESVNQKDRILYSSAKNNFIGLLQGYNFFSCETKDEVREKLENESFIENNNTAAT